MYYAATDPKSVEQTEQGLKSLRLGAQTRLSQDNHVRHLGRWRKPPNMSSLQTHPKKKAEFSLIQIDRDVLGPGHVFSMCSHWMGVTTLFYQLIHTISFVKVRCDLSAKFTQAKSLCFILLGIHSKATLGSEREV